ncbi:MAG: hypothetical protein AAGF23_03340 [Acidobacteriota bacterium]
MTVNATGRLAVEAAGGRRTFHCPRGPGLRCVKLAQTDPAAEWDFFLVQIHRVTDQSSQLTIIAPLAGGGLRRIVSRVSAGSLRRITHLETYEAATFRAGAVHLRFTEVRRFYDEVRHDVIRLSSTCQDFDADGRPAGPPGNLREDTWPTLAASVPELLRELDPDGATRGGPRISSAGVSFAAVEALPDGDFEVGDGAVHTGSDRGALRSLGDGLHVLSSFQEGLPTLITHDYYRVEGGRIRRLFGDRAGQRVARSVIEVYRRREKGGLFRSKSTLSTLRRELRVSETVWEDT